MQTSDSLPAAPMPRVNRQLPLFPAVEDDDATSVNAWKSAVVADVISVQVPLAPDNATPVLVAVSDPMAVMLVGLRADSALEKR